MEDVTQTRQTKTGTVAEVLPRSLYRVHLANGQSVTAGLAVEARYGLLHLIVGDSVIVMLAAEDPTRGKITRKL